MSADPDDRYGDAVVAAIEIKIRRNGAMSVAGAINDLPSALAMLEAAKESIKSHHGRQRIAAGGLILPKVTAA